MSFLSFPRMPRNDRPRGGNGRGRGNDRGRGNRRAHQGSHPYNRQDRPPQQHHHHTAPPQPSLDAQFREAFERFLQSQSGSSVPSSSGAVAPQRQPHSQSSQSFHQQGRLHPVRNDWHRVQQGRVHKNDHPRRDDHRQGQAQSSQQGTRAPGSAPKLYGKLSYRTTLTWVEPNIAHYNSCTFSAGRSDKYYAAPASQLDLKNPVLIKFEESVLRNGAVTLYSAGKGLAMVSLDGHVVVTIFERDELTAGLPLKFLRDLLKNEHVYKFHSQPAEITDWAGHYGALGAAGLVFFTTATYDPDIPQYPEEVTTASSGQIQDVADKARELMAHLLLFTRDSSVVNHVSWRLRLFGATRARKLKDIQRAENHEMSQIGKTLLADPYVPRARDLNLQSGVPDAMEQVLISNLVMEWGRLSKHGLFDNPDGPETSARARCSFCGHIIETDEQTHAGACIIRNNGINKCHYILCGKSDHSITMCPVLHGKCSSCGLRGHLSDHHRGTDMLFLAVTWAQFYRLNLRTGFIGQIRFVRQCERVRPQHFNVSIYGSSEYADKTRVLLGLDQEPIQPPPPKKPETNSEVAKLQQEVEQLKKDKAKLQQELAQTQNQGAPAVFQLQQELEAVKKQNQQFQKELADAAIVNTKLQEELLEERAEVKKLEEHSQRMHKSKDRHQANNKKCELAIEKQKKVIEALQVDRKANQAEKELMTAEVQKHKRGHYIQKYVADLYNQHTQGEMHQSFLEIAEAAFQEGRSNGPDFPQALPEGEVVEDLTDLHIDPDNTETRMDLVQASEEANDLLEYDPEKPGL